MVAPQIKFRFKLRVEQSDTIDTINAIIDKVQQYYINISSRIGILSVKKLECQRARNLLKSSYLPTRMSCRIQSQSCWRPVLHAMHDHCQLRQKFPYWKAPDKGKASEENANNMSSLPAAVPSQLKETIQDQARPCLHVNRHTTLQAKKPSDSVTLLIWGKRCHGRLSVETMFINLLRPKQAAFNKSFKARRYLLSLTKVNLTIRSFWTY